MITKLWHWLTQPRTNQPCPGGGMLRVCPFCRAELVTVPTCGPETPMRAVTLDRHSCPEGDWVRLPDGRARRYHTGEPINAWWRFNRHVCEE